MMPRKKAEPKEDKNIKPEGLPPVASEITPESPVTTPEVAPVTPEITPAPAVTPPEDTALVSNASEWIVLNEGGEQIHSYSIEIHGEQAKDLAYALAKRFNGTVLEK